MEYTLHEMFPELKLKVNPEIYSPSLQDLQNNSYFHHLVDLITNQYRQVDSKSRKKIAQVPYSLKQISEFDDVKSNIQKIMPKVVPIQVPKGTIIYTIGAAPDQGYFLVHGCVELLAKKNNWERLEIIPGHTLFNAEERIDYLQNHFHIDPKHFQALQSLFYQDKMTFNFLPFLKLYSGEYFGFKELVRGCLRTKLAIAIQDSILIKVKKHEFDKYLKDFEEKREHYIINCIFQGIKSEIIEDMLGKISVVFNSSEIIKYDRDQQIFREGELVSGLYFILDGQVQQSKNVKIEVPKKFLANQNQKDVMREVTVKLHKVVKNAFVGQIQPLMSMKNREFTCTATLNNTILLKLDSVAFLKAVSESPLYERELSFSTKHKYSVTSDLFLKQKSQIVKSYLNQYEQFDHRKKQKNIAGMLNNDVNFKLNGLYELFKKEGVFYRDTFERLEGFEEFAAKYDPKRASINRHKIKSTNQEPKINGNTIKREARQTQQRSPTEEADLSFEATKKLLMSPGKTVNHFEALGSELIQKLSPISEHSSSSIVKRKRKGAPKFQQLKKDQTIFKRVLIKNGRYEVPRQTDKSNRVQAIVNHKFDEVVKQCMTRKNVAIRKAMADNRQDLIKEEFRKTLTSLPSKSFSMTRLGSTSFGYTCKGTEEMKKRLEKLKWNKSSPLSSAEKTEEDPRLQQCIGYNQQPLSSEIKHRSAISSSKISFHNGRSPEKIVLLNHMMKPITYTSTQI